MYGIDLSGKVAVVASVANKWSIAWGIARVLHSAGARLILPYVGDRERGSIQKLTDQEGWGDDVIIPPEACNVGEDDQIQGLFDFVEGEVGRVNCFAHCIAFAPREALQGAFMETSREAFQIALDISTYSFVAMTRAAAALMTDGGTILTLTFMASEKVFPSYNVMGSAKAALEHTVRQLASELGPRNIRVNALSAGPISTVSARGIKGFTDFLQMYQDRAPLGRNITQEEVGKAGLFLLSELSSGVTGEVLHVDGGYNIIGA